MAPPPRRTGRNSALGLPIAVGAVAFSAWNVCKQAFTLPASASDVSTRSDVAKVADVDRRSALLASGGALLAGTTLASEEVLAADVKSVVVAGASGQTGRKVVQRLVQRGGLNVIGAVRNTDKAKKDLESASVQLRGAMIDKVDAIDTKGVELKSLDVAKDSVDKMASVLQGTQALVIATGFVPGNPFAMNAEAHAVDNVGTIALVDAAKKAGVQKVVLVSSILTDARAWGKEGSAGFQVTNAFGNVLDEKLVAEKYLRASGLDYTIVRPGGLKSEAATGNLVLSAENTLDNGEVSRDLVADVSVAAVFDAKSANKVVEIIEDPKAAVVPQDKWFA
eukprot:TRINITY_DN19365_c0_g1_i1.p1 TRINITY_DN19365_c0_g1~~TRINITY_DN19365_c0_g1_i1.p1  ORF type:complete len:336 (+),score=115.23 TRINITY_DN19365_c0_g1_i1:67-1074(+)